MMWWIVSAIFYTSIALLIFGLSYEENDSKWEILLIPFIPIMTLSFFIGLFFIWALFNPLMWIIFFLLAWIFFK